MERRLAAFGADLLVLEGARWWARSPDPGNPVACATCHFDPALTRRWAASFPKVRPLPPPDRRVMTLLQANAEAVRLHYRLADPRPAATAITAYLTFLGRDVPVTPGIAESQPVFPERIERLERSVQEGEAAFAVRCRSCHDPAAAAGRSPRFPRAVEGRVESLESFIEGHQGAAAPLVWDAPVMADLVAYLTAQRRGRPVGMRSIVWMTGGAAEEDP
jgi:mono/diheme cytochrome c family protein